MGTNIQFLGLSKVIHMKGGKLGQGDYHTNKDKTLVEKL